MSPVSEAAAQAAIGAAARELRLPTVRSEAARLAEIAARDHATHLGYLAEVLSAELDDRSGRRRARRIADAAANRTFTAVAGSSGGYSIRVHAGSYVVIAGRADRSPYQQQITVQPGEHLTLNLTITPPTGSA